MSANSLPSWSDVISALNSGVELEKSLATFAMREILSGNTEPDQIKEFLIAHAEKGATAAEVAAFIEVMYEHAAPLEITERAVDVVGTGGDGFHTINISTASAIVCAASGAKIMKHGNRAASSKSGSADLLEALKIKIDLDGVAVAKVFNEIGIAFAFAPKFHSAMRFAAPVRKELGRPTIFNILGPLSNPAKPAAYAIGVALPNMVELVADVLARRGVDALVFRGDDGMDEVTLTGSTTVYEISKGGRVKASISPEDFGIARSDISELRGGDGAENAKRIKAVFAGESGAPRNAILLNSAMTLVAYNLDKDSEKTLVERVAEQIKVAENAIDSGAATALVEKWSQISNSL